MFTALRPVEQDRQLCKPTILEMDGLPFLQQSGATDAVCRSCSSPHAPAQHYGSMPPCARGLQALQLIADLSKQQLPYASGSLHGAYLLQHEKGQGTQSAAASWLQILCKMPGKDLVGRTYEPLFPYYADLKQHGAFKCGAWPDAA
jgi:hypothetical protein